MKKIINKKKLFKKLIRLSKEVGYIDGSDLEKGFIYDSSFNIKFDINNNRKFNLLLNSLNKFYVEDEGFLFN